MRNPAQILQIMIDSEWYCRGVPFMCNALFNAYAADDITDEEMGSAEYIINQLAFETYGSDFFAGCLIHKLKEAGVVERGVSAYQVDAFNACLAVYVGWIEKLSVTQSEDQPMRKVSEILRLAVETRYLKDHANDYMCNALDDMAFHGEITYDEAGEAEKAIHAEMHRQCPEERELTVMCVLIATGTLPESAGIDAPSDHAQACTTWYLDFISQLEAADA